MKSLNYILIAVISLGISLNIESASYLPKVNMSYISRAIDYFRSVSMPKKNNSFSINELLNIDSARDYIIKELFNDPNSKEIIKRIKLTGDKELIKHISSYFEYYEDKYGDNEHGIPSVFPWKWFGVKHHIGLIDHTGPIYSVAISHDNSFIVTVAGDHKAKIWDSKTGLLINTLEGHTDLIVSVAISRDNSFIITGSYDKTAKIWNSTTGELIETLRGHYSYIKSISISKDDTFVVTGSYDRTAKIWDSKTGKLIKTLRGHTDFIFSLSISYDNSFIVTGSRDKTAKIFYIKEGRVTTLRGHSDSISSVAISKDSSFVVTGSYDKTATIWNIKTDEIIKLIGHTGPVYSVAISQDNSFIVTGSKDKTAKIWNSKTGELINTLKGDNGWFSSTGHANWITLVKISKDNSFIVTGSLDKTVKIWDSKTGELIKTLRGHSGPIELALAISQDDSVIVTGSYDATAKIWDIKQD